MRTSRSFSRLVTSQQLQLPVEVARRRVDLHELSETRAVHVRNVAEVEQQLAIALLEQALNLVLDDDIATLAQGDVADDLHDRHITRHSLSDLHSSS